MNMLATIVSDEVWKTIPGFDAYAVSASGQVKRILPGGRNHACRQLIPWARPDGYKEVTLCQNGRKIKRLVHQIVCEAFYGLQPSTQHEVAHGDGTTWNNHVNNLRWATRKENMADSLAHGTRAKGKRHGRTTKPDQTPRGAAHGHAKLTEDQVYAIRAANGVTGRSLAQQYAVSPALISLIRSRTIWSHI